MTRDVAIIGAGMVPFGRYPDATHADIAVPAILAAMEDANIPREAIETVYCGSSFGGMLTGQRVLRELGMTGPPVVNVENACSSGSTAIRDAYLGIRAGEFDVALVFGIDKLTQFGGGTLPLEPEDHEGFLAELGLERSGLERLIERAYRLLGLLTYFTTGPEESRAWTVPQGATAPRAAREIHTDFERGFIKAEVITFEDFDRLGSEAAAREAGRLRIEGKDYVVQDGDVIHFRFNV